jgi:hypothetical protein
MRILIGLLCALVALALPASGPTQAAKGVPNPAQSPRLELLVLEVHSCNVCGLMRRFVLPRYLETSHARSVPMRFVDITNHDEMKLGLDEPVTIVPTTVLLRDGREVERFAGYYGPENALIMIGHVLRNETD